MEKEQKGGDWGFGSCKLNDSIVLQVKSRVQPVQTKKNTHISRSRLLFTT